MTATDQRRPTAADVAHLKVGDQVEAVFEWCGKEFRVSGGATDDPPRKNSLHLLGFMLRWGDGDPGENLVRLISPLPPSPPARPDGWYLLTGATGDQARAVQSLGGRWLSELGNPLYVHYYDGWEIGPRLVELGPDDLVVTVPEDVQEMLLRYDWHGEDIDTYSCGAPIHAGILVARAVADARGIPHAGRDGQAGEAE